MQSTFSRESCYNRLRILGLSVESADEWAQRLSQRDPVDVECMLLTAEGCTQDEIARELGVCRKGVWRRLERCRKRLCGFRNSK